MIQIQIFKPATKKTSKAGNEYTLQEAYISLPDAPYPERYEFFTSGQSFPPGKYLLNLEKSIRVRQGRLEFGDLILEAPK